MSLNFNSIRTQIIRSQNKQLLTLLDITTFEEIPEQRNQNKKYYQTENGDNFMIFEKKKKPNLVIFFFNPHAKQKRFTRNIMKIIFVDSTFYIAPKFLSYQVVHYLNIY